MRSIQPSAESGVFHGEGAFWDAAAKRLRYVDMLAGDVMTLGDTAHERTHVGDVAAIVRARTGGGYVVATEPDSFSSIRTWRSSSASRPSPTMVCG